MAKKILCVVRTSTVRQEVESQKADMIGFLISKGFKEDEIEWLESQGASARTANKAYLQMLENIKEIITNSSTINSCAVWHLNRLGRIESYITSMREWFTNNHIQLYVKNPDITLLNPDGTYNTGNNIVFAVFAATIPSDTQEMMEKFRRGKERSKALGKYVGGFVPFGFKIDEEKHQVVDNDSMDLVRLVFEEYATGKYSYYKLQEELKSRSLNFTVRHIWLLLNKEIYKPYVGEELWNKVQRIREGKEWKINTKESKYCHLGLKFIKCAKCGASYIADAQIYVCLNRKQGYRYGTNCPDSLSVKCDVVDTILWDIASLEHRNWLTRASKETKEELTKKKEILIVKNNQIKEDIKGIKERQNRLNELYIDGRINKAKFSSKEKELDDLKVKLNKDLDYNKHQLTNIDEALNNVGKIDIVADWSIMASVGQETAKEQREIVVKHIKEVLIDTIVYNNRKCTLINVIDKNDIIRQFIYDYNGSKKTNNMFDKLYIIKGGEVHKYSHTGKSMAVLMTEQLKGAVEVVKRIKKEGAN